WTPPTALLNQSGDRPVYVPRAARFVPGDDLPEQVPVAGGIAGAGTAEQFVEHADAAGGAGARRARAGGPRRLAQLPTRTGPAAGTAPTSVSQEPVAVPQLGLDEHPELFRGRTHGIVDFSAAGSSKDIHTAVAEGYDSVELVKRYTTAT